MKIEFKIDSEALSARASAFLDAALNEATFKDEVKNEMALSGRSERSAIERLLKGRLRDSINGAVDDKIKELIASDSVRTQLDKVIDTFLTKEEQTV